MLDLKGCPKQKRVVKTGSFVGFSPEPSARVSVEEKEQVRRRRRRKESMGGVLLIVRTASALLLLLLCCRWAEAVWMNLPKSGTKCVSEEIQANVVVLANYMALYDDEQPVTSAAISVKVTSPYGSTLHHRENVTRGEFAFTTTEPGNYLACFWLDGEKRDSVVSVSLNWRIGIAARDWDTIARKEKIQGVELELKKLEEVVEEIHENLLLLRDREAEMRDTSEKTNSRVAWCSIFSLGVCIAVSALQLWHLKGFFQKKKLI